jgi:hypothetical protein
LRIAEQSKSCLRAVSSLLDFRIIIFLFDEHFLLSPVCGYQPFVLALSHFQGVILAFLQAYIARDGGKEGREEKRVRESE